MLGTIQTIYVPQKWWFVFHGDKSPWDPNSKKNHHLLGKTKMAMTIKCWGGYELDARWSPYDRCKWSYNPYNWPLK